jgi:CheY-like chemotaxis protein
MEARVLVVEDDPDQLEGNAKDITLITEEERHHIGIESFVVDKAMNEEEAMALLKRAAQSLLPYDLVLLDLSLPLNKDMLKESPDRGLRILKFVAETGAAKGVIVASVFSMYDYVVKSFRGGAVDFIAKPYDRATLQTQVLKYFENEGARLLEQRIKDLIPFAEKGLAHRLGVCFSRFVQSVVNETEGLEEGFKERWGLDVDRDLQDSQVLHLTEMESAITSAKSEWQDIVSALIGGRETPDVGVLEEVLSQIEDTVRPCLALKQVKLNLNLNGRTLVRTFRDDLDKVDDVRTVLKEIILGALSDLTNHDNSGKKTIEVSIKRNCDRVEILFEDNLRQIDKNTIDYVNKGIIVPPNNSFGRSWGLSVAQHLALRGGGRINVEYSEGRNVISYSVPLADHA